MAVDTTYQAKNYEKQGGDTLVIGGTLEIATGATITNADAANVISAAKADYTTGDLDTEAELITAINALAGKFNSLLAACKTFPIVKSA